MQTRSTSPEVGGDPVDDLELEGDLVDDPEFDGDLVDDPELDGDLVDDPELDGDLVDDPELDGDLVDDPEFDGDLVNLTQISVKIRRPTRSLRKISTKNTRPMKTKLALVPPTWCARFRVLDHAHRE